MSHPTTRQRRSASRLKYRFPWRQHNWFDLLIDGPRFFSAMLAEIERAEKSVWLEIYLIQSGEVANRFIAALLAAVRRGVEVRLMLDDFGAYRFSQADHDRLTRGGVHVAFYNILRYGKFLHNMFRDHRKLLVVDGRVAFVGGAGITDDFDPADPDQRWRETMARIEGPVVADWQALFADVWNHHVEEAMRVTPPVAEPSERPDGAPGRVTATSGPIVQEIKRSLIRYLLGAHKRVWISTAYFIPSRRVRSALRQAARRGIDVRLLLPGPYTDHPAVRHAGRRFYPRLLHAGVRIFEYQPRFLHSKAILCDNWVSIGSSNLDRWNLHWNLEANQEVNDAEFARSVTAMFEADFAESREVDYYAIMREPWYMRLWERWWGKVDLWLTGLQMLRVLRKANPPAARPPQEHTDTKQG